MPEVKNYTFEHHELAEILVRKLDIHEGLWGLYIEFGIVGANMPIGPESQTILPVAIDIVKRIGIQRFEESNNLTVDASKVNPVPAKKKSVR